MSGIKVHTMAEYLAKGEAPDILFWVGCAGSFDDRAKKNHQSYCQDIEQSRNEICRARSRRILYR